MKQDRKFWLFKSEPSCFSFEALQRSPGGCAHWDGVRNYQARNYLRDDIQPGDGVLFYHSSIRQPHVAGIAGVVKGGYPDWTALDPGSEHHDPRCSADNPVWYMVDVCFVAPFPVRVTLEEMRGQTFLKGMQLLRKSRLSIQPVTRAEWQTILQMGSLAASVVELMLDSLKEG